MTSVTSAQELILNVGTDTTVQKILQLGFQESAYRLVTVATAREAFSYLSANQVAYMIIESHLPDTSGLLFAEKVKKQWPDGYILVLTDFRDLEDTIKALDGPVDEYLLIPIRFEQVLSIIKRFSRLRGLQAIIKEKTQRIRELEEENKNLYAKLQEIYPHTQVRGTQGTTSASQQRQIQALSSYAQHIQNEPNEEK